MCENVSNQLVQIRTIVFEPSLDYWVWSCENHFFCLVKQLTQIDKKVFTKGEQNERKGNACVKLSPNSLQRSQLQSLNHFQSVKFGLINITFFA